VDDDPGELHDQVSAAPDRRETMASKLETWTAQVPEFTPTMRPNMPSRDALREGLADELEALGYVDH
jgi:hypothetical protein